jgi:cbb3-type cytochrome oxidase subunit 3
MSTGFLVGFAVFLVLMAGLAVAVVRFAIRESRRRPRAASQLDEAAAPTLVDDPDEGRDG